MTVTLYNNCGASTRTGLSIDQVRYRLPRLGITPAYQYRDRFGDPHPLWRESDLERLDSAWQEYESDRERRGIKRRGGRPPKARQT